MMGSFLLLSAGFVVECGITCAQPLEYLDEFCHPYYPHADFPKLITPQWVGEEGVEAVVTLGIDDMRDPNAYEAYLRPILDRLKEIDGRAPVSIMACSLDPQHPQLQSWLKEGLSIEVHTVDHPCPCLQNQDFAAAKSTYDRCVDLMAAIPGNQPVAFRFPCMDSMNTPSPRAYMEIVNQTTEHGRFLQASSSVMNVFTSSDREIPVKLTKIAGGKERFAPYLPFASFVNTIENYPYPYLIGKLCWEFPCTVPDDWQGQNRHSPFSPQIVEDLVAALEASIAKRGMANVVFHPHGWIRAEQMVHVIDRLHDKYGRRVKFLTFRECVDRINKYLLLDEPVRGADGEDNGIRLLDLNNDGFMDVLIGNDRRQTQRLWKPSESRWLNAPSPLQFTRSGADQQNIDLGVKFGFVRSSGNVCAVVHNDQVQAMFEFQHQRFVEHMLPSPLKDVPTTSAGQDQGVRLRDLNHDGVSEILIGNSNQRTLWAKKYSGWVQIDDGLPASIVDAEGRDCGVRFADIDLDGFDDLIVSNESQSGIHLYDSESQGLTRAIEGGHNIPLLVRQGKNHGSWVAGRSVWWQNETTSTLSDGVDRRSFAELLGGTQPQPRSPEHSLKSLRVQPGFRVELVAAEPLVMDPIAVDWGADGKLWVVEMADYPLGLDDNGKPGGRVRFLEDSNGDGKYDQSTVFLDSLPFPTGIMAWHDGVLISGAPDVIFAKDTDGDGKADVRNVLYRGFVEGNQQHRVNGFAWGLDNWIYLANGDSGGVIESVKLQKSVDISRRDLRIRPDTGELDVQTGQTQFGRHRDDHGNWFGCVNPLPVRHYVLADHYLRRNPLLAAPKAARDIARYDNTQLFPISHVLSHWSGYVAPLPGQPHRFTSACSTSVFRDTLWGPAFVNNTFTSAPVHNAVHRRVLVPRGISFESERPEDAASFEFLASTDSWFRPTTVTTGPDGALWVVDMYRLVIEHPAWIDDQHEKELFLRAGHDQGRIYRIYPESLEPRTTLKLEDLPTAGLVDLLNSPNGRQRDMAQRLLIHRADSSAIQPLRNVARLSPNPLARLHALCTLDGLQKVDVTTLLATIDDVHATVRRHAIRIGESHISTNDGLALELQARLRALVDDPDPMVRLQLAQTLGCVPGPSSTRALARLAMQDADDSFFRTAVLSSLRPVDLALFHKAISQNAFAAEAFQASLLDMAGRMEEGSFMITLLHQLLFAVDSNAVHERGLHELSQALTAWQRKQYALDTATQERIDLIVRAAGNLLDEPSDSVDDKVAAIGFLAVCPGERAAHQCEKFIELLDAQQPLEIQQAIIQSLPAAQGDDWMQSVLGRISKLSPGVRAAVLAQVWTREFWIEKLLQAIANGDLRTSDVSIAQRQQLLTHNNEDIQSAAERLFGNQRATTDKVSLIEQYQAELVAAPDVELGRGLFMKHCAACHQLAGSGHAVGPDLAALKNRSRDALMTAILDPNQAVEDKYQSYNVGTMDGRTYTGIITAETTNSITLQMEQGKQQIFLRDDVETLHNVGKSLMPEGIENEIKPTDMNHLLAFLQAPEPVE